MKFPTKALFQLSLAALYFSANVALGHEAETNFWKERRKTFEIASLPAALNSIPAGPVRPVLATTEQLDLQKSSKLRALIEAIPTSVAPIQEVNNGDSQEQPLLIIQDVHMNQEAQGNISQLLESLFASKKIGTVGVEGAYNAFQFEPFYRIKDFSIVQKVLSDYFNDGQLAAASYAGVMNRRKAESFIGVDDETHYRRNVEAYLASSAEKNRFLNHIQQEEASLNEQAKSIYSAGLKDLATLKISHESGAINFGAYAQKLEERWPNLSNEDIPWQHFLTAYQIESTLNFKQVELERSQALQKLVAKMSTVELQKLLKQSQAYQAGQIGFGDFHRAIKKLFEEKNVSLNKTPAFNSYIQYALLADSFNASSLFNSLEKKEAAILRTLNLTPAETTLWNQQSQLHLKKKLADFSLTSDEWKKYSKLTADADTAFESFYREADIRSQKMTEKILAHRSATEPAALIVGGFHTDDITRLLRAKKIPFVVVSPRIMKIDSENGTSYLSVFNQQKSALGQLFDGQKLFLAPFDRQLSNAGTVGKELASCKAREISSKEGDRIPVTINSANLYVVLGANAARDRISNASQVSSWLNRLKNWAKKRVAQARESIMPTRGYMNLEDRIYNKVLKELFKLGNLSAVRIEEDGVSDYLLSHETTRKIIGRDAEEAPKNAIEYALSGEDRELAKGAIIVLIDGYDAAIAEETELSITEVLGAHYSLRKNQYYIDSRHATDENIGDLYKQLHHEVQERTRLIAYLNKHVPNWEENFDDEEVQALIERITPIIHQEVIDDVPSYVGRREIIHSDLHVLLQEESFERIQPKDFQDLYDRLLKAHSEDEINFPVESISAAVTHSAHRYLRGAIEYLERRGEIPENSFSMFMYGSVSRGDSSRIFGEDGTDFDVYMFPAEKITSAEFQRIQQTITDFLEEHGFKLSIKSLQNEEEEIEAPSLEQMVNRINEEAVFDRIAFVTLTPIVTLDHHEALFEQIGPISARSFQEEFESNQPISVASLSAKYFKQHLDELRSAQPHTLKSALRVFVKFSDFLKAKHAISDRSMYATMRSLRRKNLLDEAFAARFMSLYETLVVRRLSEGATELSQTDAQQILQLFDDWLAKNPLPVARPFKPGNLLSLPLWKKILPGNNPITIILRDILLASVGENVFTTIYIGVAVWILQINHVDAVTRLLTLILFLVVSGNLTLRQFPRWHKPNALNINDYKNSSRILFVLAIIDYAGGSLWMITKALTVAGYPEAAQWFYAFASFQNPWPLPYLFLPPLTTLYHLANNVLFYARKLFPGLAKIPLVGKVLLSLQAPNNGLSVNMLRLTVESGKKADDRFEALKELGKLPQTQDVLRTYWWALSDPDYRIMRLTAARLGTQKFIFPDGERLLMLKDFLPHYDDPKVSNDAFEERREGNKPFHYSRDIGVHNARFAILFALSESPTLADEMRRYIGKNLWDIPNFERLMVEVAKRAGGKGIYLSKAQNLTEGLLGLAVSTEKDVSGELKKVTDPKDNDAVTSALGAVPKPFRINMLKNLFKSQSELGRLVLRNFFNKASTDGSALSLIYRATLGLPQTDESQGQQIFFEQKFALRQEVVRSINGLPLSLQIGQFDEPQRPSRESIENFVSQMAVWLGSLSLDSQTQLQHIANFSHNLRLLMGVETEDFAGSFDMLVPTVQTKKENIFIQFIENRGELTPKQQIARTLYFLRRKSETAKIVFVVDDHLVDELRRSVMSAGHMNARIIERSKAADFSALQQSLTSTQWLRGKVTDENLSFIVSEGADLPALFRSSIPVRIQYQLYMLLKDTFLPILVEVQTNDVERNFRALRESLKHA